MRVIYSSPTFIYSAGPEKKENFFISFFKSTRLYEWFIVRRIKRHLFFSLSKEEKEMMFDFHSYFNYFKCNGKERDAISPFFEWKQGIAVFKPENQYDIRRRGRRI